MSICLHAPQVTPSIIWQKARLGHDHPEQVGRPPALCDEQRRNTQVRNPITGRQLARPRPGRPLAGPHLQVCGRPLPPWEPPTLQRPAGRYHGTGRVPPVGCCRRVLCQIRNAQGRHVPHHTVVIAPGRSAASSTVFSIRLRTVHTAPPAPYAARTSITPPKDMPARSGQDGTVQGHPRDGVCFRDMAARPAQPAAILRSGRMII